MAQPQGSDAGRRSDRHTLFLKSFEDYVSEVVSSNHGMKAKDMRKVVKDNFRRSLQANVDYHALMASTYRKDGDASRETYHKLMADVYRSLVD